MFGPPSAKRRPTNTGQQQEPLAWQYKLTGDSNRHVIIVDKELARLLASKSGCIVPLYAVPQPPAVAQEPVMFVNLLQFAKLTDPEDESGKYLPVRRTSVGKFTDPLYAAPQPLARVPLTDGECLRQISETDHVLVPRILIGAACSAIDKKREGAKTLAELRRYTTGDLSAVAIQPARQPLHEEQIDAVRLEIGYAAGLSRFTSIVRAIEAAHGIAKATGGAA